MDQDKALLEDQHDVNWDGNGTEITKQNADTDTDTENRMTLSEHCFHQRGDVPVSESRRSQPAVLAPALSMPEPALRRPARRRPGGTGSSRPW
ncbi:hypothetical protein VTH06DRAFT_4260 [Thermothelomyces fergusii]